MPASVLSPAHTEKFGDGKIFVIPIDDVIRIRTEERREAALWEVKLTVLVSVRRKRLAADRWSFRNWSFS